jgi:hypothetical protein
MGCAALAAGAEMPAPQREITVVVQTLEPVQPVQGVQVRLTHMDNSQLDVDAQNPTNPLGEARLTVSPGAAGQVDLRIVISGTGDWAIYQPADGQLVTGLGPAVNKITIQLLPKRSPLLGGPAQIQALLERVTRLSQQVRSQQRQITGLTEQNAATTQKNVALTQENIASQAQLAAEQQGAQAERQDVAAEINAWAVDKGFTPDEGDAMVKQWALDNKDKEAAMSAFVLKNYPEAARLFESEAGTARELRAKAMQTAQSALERNRELLRTELEGSERSARSFQLSAQYHAATEALEEVRDDAKLAHQQAPDDEDVRAVWLEATWDAANARLRESDVAPADQSLRLLAQSADDFELLAREYAAQGAGRYWAWMELDLGNTLAAEGTHASGHQAAALFDKSVQTLQNLLRQGDGYATLNIGMNAPSTVAPVSHDAVRQFAVTPLGVQINLAAVDLLAGRFGACLEQLRTAYYLQYLPSRVNIMPDAIWLACDWGAGDKKGALEEDKSLQERAHTLVPGTWIYDSDPITTYFADNSPTFAQGRASWIALLTTIRNGDSAGMTAALKQLEPIFQQ